MPLEELAQKIRLPLRLLDWRRHTKLLAVVSPGPLVSAGAIISDPHFFHHRLALDDEEPPAMHQQMIDLTTSSGAIVFWLIEILKPQAVQHEDFVVFAETLI